MPYPTCEHIIGLYFLKSSFTSFNSFTIPPKKALYVFSRFTHRCFMVFDDHYDYYILFYYTFFSVITVLMEGYWFFVCLLTFNSTPNGRDGEKKHKVKLCCGILFPFSSWGLSSGNWNKQRKQNQHHTPSPHGMEVIWRLKSILIPTAPPSGKKTACILQKVLRDSLGTYTFLKLWFKKRNFLKKS